MKKSPTVNTPGVQRITTKELLGEYVPKKKARRSNGAGKAHSGHGVALSVRRKVVRSFLGMVMKDMIMDGDRFDFKFRGKVYLTLLVADRDRDSYLYRYRVEQRGHDFIPYCITAPSVWKSVRRYFLWTPALGYQRMIRRQALGGMVYQRAPTVDYSKKRQYGLQLRVYKSQGRDVPHSEKAPGQGV